MAFIYNPGSNVALPLFYPDEDLTTQIQFLEDGTLGIPVFTDDTVTPPTYEDVVITDRWFVCQVRSRNISSIFVFFPLASSGKLGTSLQTDSLYPPPLLNLSARG